MTLMQQVEAIESREDLTAFIRAVAADLDRNPADWENDRFETYLDAMMSWTDDMPGYFSNQRLDIEAGPEWRLFGMVLLAAKIYE